MGKTASSAWAPAARRGAGRTGTSGPAAEVSRHLARRGLSWRSLRTRADEMDVLVSSRDRDAFDRALEELGYRAAPSPRPTGMSADRDRRIRFRVVDTGLHVVESISEPAYDSHGGHSNRWIVPGLAAAILAETGESGPALALESVLHETINRGGSRPERLAASLARLSEADPAGRMAARLLSERAALVFSRAARAGAEAPAAFLALRRETIRAVRAASWRDPGRHISRTLQGLADRSVFRRLARRGETVCLAGPDGVGKTSVAGAVVEAEAPPRVRFVYRYNGRSKDVGIGLLVRRIAKTAWFAWESLALKRSAPADDLKLLAEIRTKRTAGYLAALRLRLRGHAGLDVVVLDRGLVDELAGLTSDAAIERAHRILARRPVGTESFVLLLTDDAETIHGRKDEKSPAEIALTIEGLRDTLDRFRDVLPSVEIPVNGMPMERVAERVAGLLVDRACGRSALEDRSSAADRDRQATGERQEPPVVTLFATGFPGPGEPVHDGIHKAVDGIAEALAADGLTVRVLSQAAATDRHERCGYEVLRFAGGGRFSPAPGLHDFIEREPGSGLYVLNGMFNVAVHRVSRQLRRLGRPYVVAPHDPYSEAVFAKSRLRKALWWHLVERRLLAGAAAIQVLDERHGRLLSDLGIDTPWFALPNGYRTSDLDEGFQPLEPHEGPARLFFLGRLDAHNKGLDLLLRAAAREPRVSLTLQGPDWGDLEGLRALVADLALGDRVQILAPDFESTPGALISAHDVFCLPSRFEGFGLAALEAMLAARPVLITNVGGLARYVKECDGGTVTEPTVESILGGLHGLLERRADWTRMGTSAREFASHRLTWSAVAVDTRREYLRLIRTPVPDPAAIAR